MKTIGREHYQFIRKGDNECLNTVGFIFTASVGSRILI
jgi:hypothetical protein